MKKKVFKVLIALLALGEAFLVPTVVAHFVRGIVEQGLTTVSVLLIVGLAIIAVAIEIVLIISSIAELDWIFE